ncbi:MAG: ABC transporter permease [Clostridia bacterium]|nr:ABC transporter permease [Clostridia bacterium]
MTVFKTFLQVLKKNKFIVIMYTVILLIFGNFSMQSNQSSTNFEASKPTVFIVNEDKEEGITKDFIKYVEEKCDMAEIENSKEAIDDALFYEDLSLAVYIPQNFGKDFMEGKEPQITIKKRDSYYGSLAEMLLQRYIKVATIYQKNIKNEDELVAKINETISKDIETEVTTKIDTSALTKAARYYNFSSYSFLACLIYIISLIISTFNEEKVQKRTTISSYNYRKFNRILLLGNSLYAFVLWILYVVMSFVFVGPTMASINGLLFIANSFIFVICATTLAFFIANFVKNKDSINGIVNVIGLGSSFLCGAFIPQEWLPETVKIIGHVFPTYYFITGNETIAKLEEFNIDTLMPVIVNAGIVIAFSVVFVILTNLVTKKKRKV